MSTVPKTTRAEKAAWVQELAASLFSDYPTLQLGCIEGISCPVCSQQVRIIVRPITWRLAAVCIALARSRLSSPLSSGAPFEYEHVPSVLTALPLESKAKAALGGGGIGVPGNWGLIEREPTTGPSFAGEDDLKAGRYRLTQKGYDFALGLARVPEFAVCFNRKTWALKGPLVDVDWAIKKKFDRNELLRWNRE